MRRGSTISAFVFGLAICLATIFGVNRSVDPARLFGSGEEELAAATVLAEGSYLVGAENLDLRLVQRYLAAGVDRSPSIVVLGSSRSWEIGNNIFAHEFLLNQSVPAADLDDVEGMLNMWRKRGFNPGLVVLGIDPWMFNRARTTGLGYVKPTFAYDDETDGRAKSPQITLHAVRALFSLRYFLDSIRTWRAQASGGGGKSFRAAGDDHSNAAVFRPDGTFKHPRRVLERTPGEIEALARRVGRDIAFWGLENFSGLDPNASYKLEKILRDIRSMGAEAVIYLPAYHPLAYQTIREQERYAMVETVEAHLRAVAREFGLKIVGSFDPHKSKCSDNDFIDHHHPRRSCVERVFRSAM